MKKSQAPKPRRPLRAYYICGMGKCRRKIVGRPAYDQDHNHAAIMHLMFEHGIGLFTAIGLEPVPDDEDDAGFPKTA